MAARKPLVCTCVLCACMYTTTSIRRTHELHLFKNASQINVYTVKTHYYTSKNQNVNYYVFFFNLAPQKKKKLAVGCSYFVYKNLTTWTIYLRGSYVQLFLFDW